MQQATQKAPQKRFNKGKLKLDLTFHCHPTFQCNQSLKALALVRSQKVEESLVLCDEVLEARPTDDGILTAMMHALRGLGRRTFPGLNFNHLVYNSVTDNDMVTMFEEAYKKQPTNEELGCQTFFANVRANHWKAAHQARKLFIPITYC